MNDNNQVQHSPQQYPQVYAPYYEDEVSLIDLWLILVRRKALIVKIFLFFLVVAIALAFIKKDKYEFSTSVEIGRIVSGENNDQYQLVEEPESVKAKLEDAYLPNALLEFYREHPEEKILKFDVSVPKKANILIVKSKGVESESEKHKSLQSNAINPLIVDLNRRINAQRSQLESNLIAQKIKLDNLKDPITLKLKILAHEKQVNKEVDEQSRLREDVYWQPREKAIESAIKQGRAGLDNLKNVAKVLLERKDRLSELEKVLLRQLNDLDGSIKDAQNKRKEAIKGVSESSTAMTQLLIDSEIESLISRRSKLEERLYYELRNDKDDLENKILANHRQQGVQAIKISEDEGKLRKLRADRNSDLVLRKLNLNTLQTNLEKIKRDHRNKIAIQESVIKDLNIRLKGITNSRIIVPFLKSLQPKGLTSSVLFVIVVFLGFIFALIGAFVAEFLAKASEKMKEEGLS